MGVEGGNLLFGQFFLENAWPVSASPMPPKIRLWLFTDRCLLYCFHDFLREVKTKTTDTN